MFATKSAGGGSERAAPRPRRQVTRAVTVRHRAGYTPGAADLETYANVTLPSQRTLSLAALWTTQLRRRRHGLNRLRAPKDIIVFGPAACRCAACPVAGRNPNEVNVRTAR